MTRRESRVKVKHQSGFTLIELMVALAISSLITGAITLTIFQLLIIPAQSNNHLTAVKQVENAIHWMRRDVVQAQIMEPSGSSGFPLKLTWINWNNVKYEVTYEVQNDKLQREYVTYDADSAVTENQTRNVAEYIESDPSMTNCQVSGNVLTFKITTTIRGFMDSSETRLVEIAARPAD